MLSDTGFTMSWKGGKPLSISKFTLSMPWTLQVSCSSICTSDNNHVILSSLIHCSIFLNQRMGRSQESCITLSQTTAESEFCDPDSMLSLGKMHLSLNTSSFCRRSMSIILEAKKCSNRWWVRMAAGYTQLNEMGTETQKGWELRRPLQALLPLNLHVLHLTLACT